MAEDPHRVQNLVQAAALEARHPDEEKREDEHEREVGIAEAPAEQDCAAGAEQQRQPVVERPEEREQLADERGDRGQTEPGGGRPLLAGGGGLSDDLAQHLVAVRGADVA